MPWPKLFPEDFLADSKRKVMHPLWVQWKYALWWVFVGFLVTATVSIKIPEVPSNIGISGMLTMAGLTLITMIRDPETSGRLRVNVYEGIISAVDVAEVIRGLGWEVHYNKKDLTVGFYDGRYQEFYSLWTPYGIVEFTVDVVPGITFFCTKEEIPRCEELFRGIALLQELRRVESAERPTGKVMQ